MGNDFRDLQYFLLSDKLYYETMDHYPYAEGDFHAVVSEFLPPDWKVTRKGVWLGLSSGKSPLPVQGWKIHLSARQADSAEMLRRVAPFLISRGVPFKFLLDRRILAMANSKSWPRGASGKFMTVYPTDESECRFLLGELAGLTENFEGPYILSDRRYKKSKVVFYRYGGILLNSILNGDGTKSPVLVAPSGQTVPDLRAPFFSLPPWVSDLFPAEQETPGEGLNGGRYSVQSSLGFSNSGGVYLAADNKTGRKVVLKEGRPWINEVSPGYDILKVLEKERRLLERLEARGVAPRPVDFFYEWEHSFLVQEYLDGYVPLATWAMRNSVVLKTRVSRRETKEFFVNYSRIFTRLASLVDVVHGENVVIGDFSCNNVMVHPDTLDVKIIDLEGAIENGEIPPVPFYTPGFANPLKTTNEMTREDDYYAFGANMLYVFVRVNMLAELKPEISGLWLDHLIVTMGVPSEIKDIIDSLMDPDPLKRRKPSDAVAALPGVVNRMPDGPEVMFFPVHREDKGSRPSFLNSVAEHIVSSADFERTDRLWPAAPEVFRTNPLGVSYGASGVLKALHRYSPGLVSDRMIDWVLARDMSEAEVPPGLFHGLSGVAWVLLDLGYVKEASGIFERTLAHRLLGSSFDVATGLAGWGLTCLRFWSQNRDKPALVRAVSAGRKILDAAIKDGDTICWPSAHGSPRPLGLGFGASGISLFLAYLSVASGDPVFMEGAERAFEHDILKGRPMDGGGVSLPRDIGEGSPLLPYLESGTAGAGMTCLRLLKISGSQKYKDSLERIFVDCDRVYSVFPGRNNGMAGIGEFLLEGHRFTGDEKYLRSASRIAAGIRNFSITTEKGVGFPGNGLFRLSCDYATGSSGIMSFLHRLERGGGADFMLDELIDECR